MTKEQTSGPKEPQGIRIKGIKMGSRRSTTRQTPSASNPLCLPHCFRLFPSTSSPLPPLSPFQLAQKCAPASPQVQNPALKCARPSSSGFKMRAACAPRCANFPQNPIFSQKTRKITPCQGEDGRAVDPMERRPGNVPKILTIAPHPPVQTEKEWCNLFSITLFPPFPPLYMETAFFLFA